MSIFNKDFLKDSLIGNEDESSQFYLHQDNNFGSDTGHSNGFGLQGFGGHNSNHLQQQRGIPQSGSSLSLQQQQQQQQLYRGLSNLPQQDSAHFLNNASRQPNPFPSQGIIGGNLNSNVPVRSAADLAVGNGRLSAGVNDVGFNGLGRFGGHSAGSFNQLGGVRNDDDFLGGGNNDTDDFPALPSSNPLGTKHDTTSSNHLGMLGNNSLFLKDTLGGSDIGLTPGLSSSIPGSSPPFFSPSNNTLQIPPAIGIGSSLLGGQAAGGPGRGQIPTGHPSSLYPSSGLPGLDSGNISSNSNLSGVTGNSNLTSSQLNAPGVSSLLGGLGTSITATAAPSPGLSKESRYAMAGLLETIRSTDKDLQVLTLGTDLTTFGLNLNSVDTLYTSFVSPFVDNPPSDEPQYKTPQCYLMAHTPVLKADHWSKLTVETLFYIFYQMPRDILQACSAQELYRRDWRYHGELRIWVKPANRPDLMQPTPQFVYFDAKAWEQKFLNTAQLRGNLLAGLIPEEEIRVKVPAPGQNPVVEPS